LVIGMCLESSILNLLEECCTVPFRAHNCWKLCSLVNRHMLNRRRSNWLRWCFWQDHLSLTKETIGSHLTLPPAVPFEIKEAWHLSRMSSEVSLGRGRRDLGSAQRPGLPGNEPKKTGRCSAGARSSSKIH
jgi:hypothetical protein